MPLLAPLSGVAEESTSLTRQEYKFNSKDGTESSLWRIAAGTAAQTTTPLPALIYVHGGAFISRNTDITTVNLARLNRILSKRLGPKPLHDSGCVLLWVSYRLATESPFPGPVEDVYAAYEFALAHADDLRIQPHNIAMLGVSTGGQLAWAATHLAIDRSLRRPCGVMGLYPMVEPCTDYTAVQGPQHASLDEIFRAMSLACALRKGWHHFLERLHSDDIPDNVRKYATLLRLQPEVLAQLPPMFLDVGGRDPYMEEVELARQLLRNAQVDVSGETYPDLEHNFEGILFGYGERDVLEMVWESRRQFLQKIWT